MNVDIKISTHAGKRKKNKQPSNITTGKFIDTRCCTALADRANGDFCHPLAGGMLGSNAYRGC